MKNQIIPFQFENKSIRVVADETGEPLFVGKDICDALGYTNPSKAMGDHCRGVTIRYPIVDSLGRTQEARVLAEPDVLRLIVNCTLPAAAAFERLVFEEILPSIRKTGSYSVTPQAAPAPKVFTDYFRIGKLIGLDRNMAAISANQAALKLTGTNVLQLIGQTHLETPEQALYFNVSDLVEGISGRRMNLMLAAAGLQTKAGDRWVPTEAGALKSRVLDTGKRHGDGTPVQQIRWSRDVIPLVTPAEAA